MVPGVPVTLYQTQTSKKYPETLSPWPNGRARRRPRALTRARGGYDDPGACHVRRRVRPFQLVWKKPQNTTEGENKNNRKKRPKHPCRLASRKRASEGASELKPRKFQENPKNARGPEWHPEKTPRSGTHGQKGRTNKCGGTKKGTGKSNQSACGGVPCYYLIFLS